MKTTKTKKRDLQPFVQSPTQVTRLSVQQLRGILDAHDDGLFMESGLLADALSRHAELGGALEQRLAAAPGLPFELEAADSSTNAAGLRSRVNERWSRVFPRGSQRAMLRDRVVLGFAFARITGTYDPSLDEIVPYVERWHPSLIRFDRVNNRWLAWTDASAEAVIVDEYGRVAEGWIVTFVGDRLSSHIEGCVRALGEPFLGSQFASRDSRRHSERMGQGVLEAMVPGNQAEDPEAQQFVKGIAKVGSTGVIVTPQYLPTGEDAQASYGVKLHFPPDSGMKGLLALDDHETARMRLRILGQDTTSKDASGGGYARSQTGAGVRQDLTEADAQALNEIAEQLFDGWALLEGRPRRLWPCAEWDATPPADAEREARIQQSRAQGIAQLTAALPGLSAAAQERKIEIDYGALFAQFGIPVVNQVET